ncbi:MAG: AAA family ATPase, partial [Planctomycetaceae bacterium]
MKILELELLAYGPFTGTTLDLSDGNSGFHIIHGPNEAGKSSTLRAIHGLLFGIKSNTTDNFLHDNKKLRIGGRITNSAGGELHFHRRKGNKDTLLNPAAEKGGAYPDDVLEPFVRGVAQQTFANVFGIGNTQLEDGGQEMAELRGLVGESLFAATVGGPGLAKLLKDLDEEAASIFASRKSSSAIKKLAARRKEIEKERQALRLTMSSWKNLQSDLGKARNRRDDVVAREKALSKQLRRFKRIQSGISLIGRRQDTLRQLEELSGASVLPDGYSAETRNKVETELAAVRRRVDQLNQKLKVDRRQLEDVSIPSGLLEFEDSINQLRDRHAVTVQAQSDTGKLRRRIETLETQASDLLSDLGFKSSLENAEKYRLKPEDQIVIQNLAADEKRLRGQPQSLAREREDLQTKLSAVQRELDELGKPPKVSELKAVLEEVGNVDELKNQREQLQRSLDDASRLIDQQFSTLGLWTGSLKKLKSLTAPLEETVQRFREDFAQQQNAAELLRHEADRLNDELGQVRQEIATLQTAGSVPTESELNQLRADRDELWQSVRDDWLREVFTKSIPISKAEKLASQFARSIGESDQLADRLRRETERVAQLAGHTARQSRIEEQIEQVETASKNAMMEAAELEKEWKKLWKSVGVSDPLSPAEMAGWLRRLHELREALSESDQFSQRLEALAQREKEAAEQLRQQLKSIGEKALVRDSLKTLTGRANDIVDAAQLHGETHRRLVNEVSQLTIHLERVTREDKRAVDELAEWQAQWSARMKQLGTDETAIAEQANERINSLNRLFELLRQIRQEEQRVAEIETDAELFAREVNQLASRFLGETDSDATGAAIELFNVLQTARADQTRLEAIQESEHNTNAELLVQKKAEATLAQELDAMCRLAGVSDAASLPEKERTSTELAELIKRRHELEDQLHEQTAGQSLDEFISDANTVDADELPEQINRIERELAELESERDAAVVAVNELENQAAEADGNDQAANLDQESLGVLARMHDEAERYMKLRLASKMLRKQIEVHRAENEDPLLQRASELFTKMTCEEFAGLRIDYDNDNAVIVGARADEAVVSVPGMSDGTRNQLFLAMRLAYIESQLDRFEPMPFIVDDILVHFDDQRSGATLQVLSEL